MTAWKGLLWENKTKWKFKAKAVAPHARGRQCSHSTHTNILHSIHFASNSRQHLSCKMIASHRRRERPVIMLLTWALWREKEFATLWQTRGMSTTTQSKSKSKDLRKSEEWKRESKKKKKTSLRGWKKLWLCHTLTWNMRGNTMKLSLRVIMATHGTGEGRL